MTLLLHMHHKIDEKDLEIIQYHAQNDILSVND